MTMLTTSEAARQTGLSRDVIRKAAEEGRLPCYRLPSGHRRFDPDDLTEFVNSLRQ